MNITTEIPKPKRKRKLRRFIVTLDGVQCSFVKVDRSEIGPKLVPDGGTLIKSPRAPQVFGGEKLANKAIARAERFRSRLQSAVFNVGAWAPKFSRFMEPGDFKVVEITVEDSR